MKIIKIENNKPFFVCIKLFQITIGLFYTHYLKKLIQNSYAIKLKYKVA